MAQERQHASSRLSEPAAGQAQDTATLTALRARLAAAERALADAQRMAAVAAVMALAGRGRDFNPAAAQTQLADAQRERALALVALEGAEQVAETLPVAVESAEERDARP